MSLSADMGATYFHGKTTIIGPEVFHFRVRNGIGWDNLGITPISKLNGLKSKKVKSESRDKRLISTP